MGRLRRSLYVGSKTEYFSGEAAAAMFTGAIDGIENERLSWTLEKEQKNVLPSKSRGEPRGTVNLI